MIQIQTLSLIRGSKILLDDADLTIHTCQKWGLIGANGSGKSSLFKLLLGEIQEDTGQCSIPKHWRLSHMAQEVASSDQAAVEYVIDGDQELRDVEKAINAADGDGEKLASLYSELENIDGYTANARAQRLMFGLGFHADDQGKPVSAFSGGWRIRLNLAKALMCRSDLLLLDEPTNHLDLDATLWLEEWLQRYKGTLLIISHDRDFLDKVINNVVLLEKQKLQHYSGNYSEYEKQRAERLALQSAAYEKQQQRISEIENFVRRFRAKATKAKQAQSRLKELERMEKIAPAHIDSPFNFRFPTPERIPQTLVTLSDAVIGYGDKALVSNIQLSLLDSSRIGLLGHNGAGKSTLIKVLANALAPLSGERVESVHIKIGYFAQHQLEALDLNASCALHLQRLSPTASEQEIRNFLGSFGFHGDRAFEEIAHFSGGEKARLALAIIAWQKPNILLLDEPTNHLDLEMRHALTLALQSYEGAIVIVSHDRHLLKNTVDQFLLVDSGKVDVFKGDLDDYQQWLSNKRLDESPEATETELGAQSVSEDSSQDARKKDKKEQRQAAAALREKLKPYTALIKRLEKQIAQMQSKVDEIDTQLADPSMYENNSDKLQSLLIEQGNAKQQLERLEEEWLEKNEELDSIKEELE